MKIKILGTGCPNCKKLEDNVKKVLEELKVEAAVEKITDIMEIMSYGVMGTPALVLDGEVKVYGRVPDTDEIKKLLESSGEGDVYPEDKSGGCCSCSCGGKC